ncbi:MAG: glycosyltransferase [Nitrospinaceae bacterium]|nr:glycosyltransferase [Nitrospinaceae bacterium]
MAKIAIFCKASFSHGMGHLVRQSHIAKILRNRGNEINFFTPDYSPAQLWLDQCGLSHQTLTDVKQVSSDLIILDVQDTSAAFIKNLRQDKKAVVSFEDLGEGRNHVDLLVDCNLGEEKLAGLPVQTLFGYNYAVLAEEFEAYHSKPRVFKNTINSVLVTFGGTDPHSLTPTLAEKLLHIQPGLSITLLAGPGNENIPALKNLANKHGKVKLMESTSEMAQTLFTHDIVFCAGGVTLHEAMAVGTPAFVINQVQHQADKANRAEKQGAALNLGMSDSWAENRLPEILQSNPKILEKTSQAGKSMIDGKGLKRIVDAIEELLKL